MRPGTKLTAKCSGDFMKYSSVSIVHLLQVLPDLSTPLMLAVDEATISI